MPERLLLTAAETADTLNLGLTTTWALIRSGELRSIRIGTAVRVPVDAVHAWIERKASAQDRQCHVA